MTDIDWAFIGRWIGGIYLFIICLAIYVYFDAKKQGRNLGKILFKVVVTTIAVGITVGVIGGGAAYVLLMGLK